MSNDDDFPASIVEAAAGSQASLAPLLAELNTWRIPFPGGPSPADGERWIADGSGTT